MMDGGSDAAKDDKRTLYFVTLGEKNLNRKPSDVTIDDFAVRIRGAPFLGQGIH